MTENLAVFKASLAACLAAVGAFLGWRVIMLLVWVALMALDYLSGTLAARQNGTWKSSMARDGIGHKVGMILIVVVSMIADFVLLIAVENLPNDVININWPLVIFPMVTMWYILTEIGSIIENAMEMGAKVPSWLPKLLNATIKNIDAVGESALKTEVAEDPTIDPFALMGFDHDEPGESGLIEED